MTSIARHHTLKRRGMDLGCIPCQRIHADLPAQADIIQAWNKHQSIHLPQILCSEIPTYQAEIKQAHQWMEATLYGSELMTYMEEHGVMQRLGDAFILLASSLEEHDEQAIEKLYFDVEEEGSIVAENLWCKASWLSFHDDDASLRFRFSWGMEGFEDVSAKPQQQAWAAELCTRLFPESKLVTEHADVLKILHHILGHDASFVERIVYFNAPDGGAQFHHDVERGHAGVVYAQLSGETYWLAASKPNVMQAMQDFSQQHAVSEELQALLQDVDALSAYMEEQDHELVEQLIDCNPAFIAYMVAQGFSHHVRTGDVLLLPQKDIELCVWHSVFSLGDEPGEALSFAIR